MLTRIEALNYRSLRYVSERLSPFQTLVGPNGSGKSSFLDVVGFLGDLLRVGPLRAIQGEGMAVPQRAADPMHLCWMRQGGWFELAVEMDIPAARLERLGNGRTKRARYETRIEVGGDRGEVRIAIETLWLTPADDAGATVERTLFPTPPAVPESVVRAPGRQKPEGWKKVVTKNTEAGTDYFMSETTGWNNPFRLGPAKSALANLPEDEDRFPVATWVKRVLMEGIRRVTLNAEAMRRPSPPGSPRHFLPDGSNLPWVVHELETRDRDRFARWIEHFRTAIPDLRTVTTIEREEDRHRYLVVEYENGLKAPSWVVSDGTLRLLALTLLAFIDGIEGVYLIEEPENGIHPRAVETVFQSLSSVYNAQVLCASHSPVILGLAKPADLLCFAKDEHGATDIVRGDEHPRLKNWKGALDLGTLFAAGVLG
ncbi:MAG: AAA family ATPase [Phycisphaeraceae bacterium]|nr:AAA family ATPase [Phycisphaerales bacterium]QOJ17071.1 MAG: AAA family ATPase [Phycisphaeraceae bacterium]